MDILEIRKMMVEQDYRNWDGFYESDTKCGNPVLFGVRRGCFSIFWTPFDSDWVEDTIQVNCKITAIFMEISGGNVT